MKKNCNPRACNGDMKKKDSMCSGMGKGDTCDKKQGSGMAHSGMSRYYESESESFKKSGNSQSMHENEKNKERTTKNMSSNKKNKGEW